MVEDADGEKGTTVPTEIAPIGLVPVMEHQPSIYERGPGED